MAHYAIAVLPSTTPSTSASHLAKMAAVVFSGSDWITISDPTLKINWRKEGVVIKSGILTDSSLAYINSGAFTDTNFTVADTGSNIDFYIESGSEIEFSDQIVLLNSAPTVSATIETSLGKTSRQPLIKWTYADPDGDAQSTYRVIASAYDSGILNGSVNQFQIPIELPEGASYSWSVEVSDGLASAVSSGTSVTNTAPVISNVKIDGAGPSTEITSFNPIISWTYSDADGHPQKSYQIKIYTDIGLTNLFWESPVYNGGATSFRYTGAALSSQNRYYVIVYAWDYFNRSNGALAEFLISNPPVIRSVTVNSKINPINLKVLPGEKVTFRWDVINPDGNKYPILAYDIRVGTSSVNLGTDNFNGDFWVEAKTSPNPYEAIYMNTIFDFPLVEKTTYYFQVKVSTASVSSGWWFGYFKLNKKPTARDVKITPEYPYHNESLLASYVFVDDPEEKESDKTIIRWFKTTSSGLTSEQTDLRNSKTVPASKLTPGDIWYFSVQPHDGVDYSKIAYTSSSVVILNRPPVAVPLGIEPAIPTILDALKAIFTISDPENDDVTLRLYWYKQEVGSNSYEEVESLRNSITVPPGIAKVGQKWYFSLLPNDGYVSGQLANSNPITIANSIPTIESITVNGEVCPKKCAEDNPIFSWTYKDVDMASQKAYRILIGTSPLRTQPSTGSLVPTPGSISNGIVSTCVSGDVLNGNDIYDSGIIYSDSSSHTYQTADSSRPIVLGAPQNSRLDNYILENDSSTMSLAVNKQNGTVSFAFSGQTGIYTPEITYRKSPSKISKYSILIDNIIATSQKSTLGDGIGTLTLSPVRIESGEIIKIQGEAIDSGAIASFTQLKLNLTTDVRLYAENFQNLSGYVPMSGHGIRLAGLAGTASTPFELPTGTYDIEIEYQTEDVGSPTLNLSINGTAIWTFNYETGNRTRTKMRQNVSLVKGDIIKITGTKNLNASAKIIYLNFKSKGDASTGAKLKDGLTYFASISVFDGISWSQWYTTTFTKSGSAWATNVSNSIGWTIEARFSLIVPIEEEQS